MYFFIWGRENYLEKKSSKMIVAFHLDFRNDSKQKNINYGLLLIQTRILALILNMVMHNTSSVL